MGDIGSRQVRYEVLPASSHPEVDEPQVESVAASDDPAPQHHERLVSARTEPARS